MHSATLSQMGLVVDPMGSIFCHCWNDSVGYIYYWLLCLLAILAQDALHGRPHGGHRMGAPGLSWTVSRTICHEGLSAQGRSLWAQRVMPARDAGPWRA
jgi:hypothetical protein